MTKRLPSPQAYVLALARVVATLLIVAGAWLWATYLICGVSDQCDMSFTFPPDTLLDCCFLFDTSAIEVWLFVLGSVLAVALLWRLVLISSAARRRRPQPIKLWEVVALGVAQVWGWAGDLGLPALGATIAFAGLFLWQERRARDVASSEQQPPMAERAG